MCSSFSDANPDLSDEDDDAEYFKEAVGEKPEDGKHRFLLQRLCLYSEDVAN